MIAELEKIHFSNDGGFMAAYLNEKGGFSHFHPEYELVLNIKSYGTRIIGDNVELFDQYDMTLISGNIPHTWNYYKTDGKLPDNHGIVVHFTRASLGDGLMMQHELHSVRELFEEAERGIAFSVEDARNAEKHLHNMINHSGIEKMIDFFMVLKIMCDSSTRRQLCSRNYKLSYDEQGNTRMTNVFTLIRENFKKQITLKDASSIAKMSPFAFSRFFKRNSGSGFVEYVNQVRINKACYLLRETDFQVQNIAGECGFTSISNFNKQFRKAVGISPRDYRAQYS
jgi:AraC-like DNA-binding protein